MSTWVGGAEETVLEEVPAAMLPSFDQITMSPPLSVKIRPLPMETLFFV